MTTQPSNTESIPARADTDKNGVDAPPLAPARQDPSSDITAPNPPLTDQFIERLERVNQDAAAISRALPGAVSRSVQSGGLGEALVPAVQRAILLMGKRDPRGLADALAPAMGSAMRRSSWGAIRSMVLRLNFWMLRHVSMKGLQWRMEAHRSRRTFEEIVIEHTQSSPVRQVFLIHRETGLLLQEAQSLSAASPQDWDIISGMLSALQDFIHDSFNMDHDTPVETIKVGRVSVLIEQGPHAAVAGILEGEARPEYKERIKDACSRIHAEFGEALRSFSGDTSPFLSCVPHLDACLRNLVNPGRLPLLPQTALALLLPVLLVAGWIMPGVVESIRWNGYINQLAEEPGIIVIDSGRKNGDRYVTGLRDPLAASPTDLLVQSGFTPSDVNSHWEPFQGLSSTLALARATRLLHPPESVILQMQNDVLTLEGTAPRQWVESARESLERWTELEHFNMDALVIANAGTETQWNDFIARLNAEPGLMIVQHGFEHGVGYSVVGLADPLARTPAQILKDAGLPESHVQQRWEAFQSSDPRIAAIRARLILSPPESVNLRLQDGVLRLEGQAAAPWIRQALQLGKSIPGIREIYTERLIDMDKRDFDAARSGIENAVFKLLVGSPDIRPGQKELLRQLVANLNQLRRSARRLDIDFLIEIRGHTAPTGDKQRDALTAEALTRSFLEILSRNAQDTRLFTRRSVGSAPPAVDGTWLDNPEDRLVSFKLLQLD